MPIRRHDATIFAQVLMRLIIAISAMTGVWSAQAETLTVYNEATGDSYVRLSQANGIGDKILWNSDMQTADGRVIGTGAGHCTQIDADRNYFCAFIIDLTDRGMISGQGVQKTEPLESSYPISGGTGVFEGIVGEIRSKPVEDRARFIYEVEYNTPSTK